MKKIAENGLAPVVILVASCTFWGLSWLPVKFFNSRGLHGFEIIFYTHFILAAVTLPFFRSAALTPRKLTFLLGIAIAGGLGIFSFTFALTYGDVVRVMVLFYLLPVWGVLGGRIFLGEKIDRIRMLGVSLALPGAFFVLGGIEIFSSPPSWIDLLALLSGMSFAANNILFRGVTSVALADKLLAMFLGCVVITGSLLWSSSATNDQSVTTSTWVLLGIYGATALVAANFGSQWAIERMDAGRSSIIIIIQLVVAVGSSIALSASDVSGTEILGFVMVLSASLLEATRRSVGPSDEVARARQGGIES